MSEMQRLITLWLALISVFVAAGYLAAGPTGASIAAAVWGTLAVVNLAIAKYWGLEQGGDTDA